MNKIANFHGVTAAGSLDEALDVLRSDRFELVKAVGQYPDDTWYELPNEPLAGLIVAVSDYLAAGVQQWNPHGERMANALVILLDQINGDVP